MPVHFPVPAMATACVEPRLLDRPRDPQASDLWRLLDEYFHIESFQQVYDQRYQAKNGYWRPIVEQSVAAYKKWPGFFLVGWLEIKILIS